MDKSDAEARVALVRQTGVPMSAADDRRVADSIRSSLRSLDVAVKGSLFDTEPQTFDAEMARLAKAVRR